MRFFLLTLAIFVTVPFSGCNSDLKCRRETALLRAEYLDLEDKYYSLLSQSGSTATSSNAISALPASAEVFRDSSPVVYGSGINQSIITHASGPEIIYYDQSGGYPDNNGGYEVQGGNFPFHQNSYPVQGESYYSPIEEYGQIPTPANTTSRAAATADNYYPSPIENSTPARPESDNSQNETLPTPDASFNDDQSRLDPEMEEADDLHEIGHKIKIEMNSLITEVVINKSVSQGKNFNSLPGDDGIELLLQPKSADGSVVDEAGDLTVSLVDPSADQGNRQIGQWTFLKEEAQLFFAEDELGNRGILLSLKWDKIVPVNKRLTVYVRFETIDGRVMETTSDIFIDPPSELTIADRRGDDERIDSDFIRLKREEDQGWYKSQTSRARSDRDSDLDWGRSTSSDRAAEERSRLRQSQRSRQPQWRPAR